MNVGRPLALILLAACEASPPGAHEREPATVPDAATDLAVVVRFDRDHDGFYAEEDCDDTDAAVHPGAADPCDGVDGDCDGVIDEDAKSLAWYIDGDGDGHGGEPSGALGCAAPRPDAVTFAGDCDDADPVVHPGACDILDEDRDCDGIIDACLDDALVVVHGPSEARHVDPPPDYATAFVTDIDGDGWPEVAQAQAGLSSGIHQCGSSEISIYHSSSITAGLNAFDELTRTTLGPTDDRCLGADMDGDADVDGDGLRDLLVGAPGDAQGGRGGPCWVTRGLGTCAAGTILVAYGVNLARGVTSLDYVGDGLHGSTPGSSLGLALAAVGDTDGDGRDDFGFLEPQLGTAFVQLGGEMQGGVSPDTESSLQVSGFSTETWAVGGVGDIDGDGLADWAVGEAGYRAEGAAWIFLGGAHHGVENAATTIRVTGAEWSGERPAVSTDIDGYEEEEVVIVVPGVDPGVIAIFEGDVLAAGGSLTPGLDGGSWQSRENMSGHPSNPGVGLSAADAWAGVDHGVVLFSERNAASKGWEWGEWHWQYRTYLLSL